MHTITALRDATVKAGDNSVTLVDRRKSVVDAGKAFVTELRTLDREPTEEEATVLAEAAAALEALDAQIEKADTSAGVLTKMAGGSGRAGRGSGTLNVKSERVAEGIASKMGRQGPEGIKALSAPGTAITSIPLDNKVLPLGQTATSVLDVLPTNKQPVLYAYMRQTLRENNAAIVAPGALKPRSLYGTERVEQRLKVAAHLSENVDKYDLEDAPMLAQFIRNELEFGLAVEIERLIVNGVFATDGLTGILNTSGVQVQPFATDIITSVRKSITMLETAGYAANTLLIHPVDYERLELSRRPGDGQFDMGANLPVARGAERVWGLARATSVAVPVGTGVVLDRNMVAVATDGRVDVQWADQIGEAFERNQLVARCETRVNVDVYSPRAVVKVELDA